MKKSDKQPGVFLSPLRKTEITEFITAKRKDGMKDSAIKKEINKAFDVELDKTDYDFPVKEVEAHKLEITVDANVKKGKESTTYQHSFTESEMIEKGSQLSQALERKKAIVRPKESYRERLWG